jgi:hypothetical protein
LAEGNSGVLAAPPVTGGQTARRKNRKFYVLLSVLMTLIVVAGFWPSYYGPLMSGSTNSPAILHFHGAIMAGWMALLILQTTLAANGRLRSHRAVGKFGIGYGTFLFLLGLVVSFVAPAMHVTAAEWTVDQAVGFLPIPLVDMLLFGGFFFAAVAYRSKPEIHKRLMLMATIALLFAAAFRLDAAEIIPMPMAIGLWFVPVVLGLVYDWATQSRVDLVYVIGFIAMGLSLLRLPLGSTEAWLSIGRPIIEAIT